MLKFKSMETHSCHIFLCLFHIEIVYILYSLFVVFYPLRRISFSFYATFVIDTFLKIDCIIISLKESVTLCCTTTRVLYEIKSRVVLVEL